MAGECFFPVLVKKLLTDIACRYLYKAKSKDQ